MRSDEMKRHAWNVTPPTAVPSFRPAGWPTAQRLYSNSQPSRRGAMVTGKAVISAGFDLIRKGGAVSLRWRETMGCGALGGLRSWLAGCPPVDGVASVASKRQRVCLRPASGSEAGGREPNKSHAITRRRF